MSELGFFGGIKFEILGDYKSEKLNILEEFKRTINGYMPDPNAIVPMMNWCSNHITNIKSMQMVNKNFFFVEKTVLARMIALNVNQAQRFIKYPKKRKEEEELAFLIPYICEYHGWSEREYGYNKDLINLEDIELHQTLHRYFGFEKKICRKLGIKIEKIKCKYDGKTVRGFF